MDRKRSTASALAALLTLAAAPAAAGHITISAGDDGIRIVDSAVVITADDDSEARVSNEGRLTVDGRRVSVGERDRQALVLYNRSLRNIERRAMEIGIEGAGLAAHAVSVAIVAIATGKTERAERRVEAHAEDIKDAARRLCDEVRSAQNLQDVIAERVPAFRPFALIDIDDDDCQIDDDSHHHGRY